jgi:hypothetical protein
MARYSAVWVYVRGRSFLETIKKRAGQSEAQGMHEIVETLVQLTK